LPLLFLLVIPEGDPLLYLLLSLPLFVLFVILTMSEAQFLNEAYLQPQKIRVPPQNP
jgi:hypothetical protein